MPLKASSIILGIFLVLMSLTGCETMRGAGKGGARGLSRDYEYTKKNVAKAYDTAGEVAKNVCDGTKAVVKKTVEKTGEAVAAAYGSVEKTDKWMKDNLW